MRYNPDHANNVLPVTARKSNRTTFSVLILILLAGSVAVMLILNHRDSVNNALDTGQCLAEEGAEDFLEMLRIFLHHAYRWIFKACG